MSCIVSQLCYTTQALLPGLTLDFGDLLFVYSRGKGGPFFIVGLL